MEKNIDFGKVAHLYDAYVTGTFDIPFWKQEALAADGPVLELMCGTGRISLPLVQAGVELWGIDYCGELLEVLERKLARQGLGARLVRADAREFRLDAAFSLIFIGFHSLSEVLSNDDKLRLLASVRRHLRPEGAFAFSLQNPAVKARQIGHGESFHEFPYGDDGTVLRLSISFSYDAARSIASGVQRYRLLDRQGKVREETELPVRFHLVGKEEMEALLAAAGFAIESLCGDYDGSAFREDSPYMIYRCRAVERCTNEIPSERRK